MIGPDGSPLTIADLPTPDNSPNPMSGFSFLVAADRVRPANVPLCFRNRLPEAMRHGSRASAGRPSLDWPHALISGAKRACIVKGSRTAASLQPTTPASRSAGKTIASTGRDAGRRCGFTRTSSSGAFLMHVLPSGLPPHPPLRALRQRQPRREHRNGPRAARRRPACRRPATAAGHHTGRAARPALPMPALRRPHDRHRGLRARLRAEVAADPNRE